SGLRYKPSRQASQTLPSFEKATFRIEAIIFGSLPSLQVSPRSFDASRKLRPATTIRFGEILTRLISECPSIGPPCHVRPELELVNNPCELARIHLFPSTSTSVTRDFSTPGLMTFRVSAFRVFVALPIVTTVSFAMRSLGCHCSVPAVLENTRTPLLVPARRAAPTFLKAKTSRSPMPTFICFQRLP